MRASTAGLESRTSSCGKRKSNGRMNTTGLPLCCYGLPLMQLTSTRRATEAKLNSLPQFLATVNETMKIHFAAVFSEDKDAIPLVLLHGWPGCFYEYYPLIEELRKSTSPSFHIIAPSNPGFCFSSKPPVDKDYVVMDSVDAMATLMTGLGLDGYIAVGADIGSLMARALTARKACRGCHGTLHTRLFRPELTRDSEHVLPPSRSSRSHCRDASPRTRRVEAG